MEMIEIPKVWFYYMIILIVTFGGWYVYTAILFKRAKLDKITAKRLKKIAEWECRDVVNQEKLIIKQYIEHYTRVHNINWDEYRLG